VAKLHETIIFYINCIISTQIVHILTLLHLYSAFIFTVSSIQSAQSSVLRFVTQWLNLLHIIIALQELHVFHPDILDLPFLLHFQETAYILECSVNPIIVELRHSL